MANVCLACEKLKPYGMLCRRHGYHDYLPSDEVEARSKRHTKAKTTKTKRTKTKRTKKRHNPFSIPHALGVGASLLSAASGLAYMMNPLDGDGDDLYPKDRLPTKQEWLNARIRELVEMGLSGVQASDRANEELKTLWKIHKRTQRKTRVNPVKKKKKQLKKKRNPLLAVIGNAMVNPPKRKKKKNFDVSSLIKGKERAGRKTKLLARDVPLEAIRNHPDFKKALASFKKFHGYLPTSVTIYEVPDGRNEADVMVILGRSPEIAYYIPEGMKSNKINYEWRHKTAEGHEVILAYNPLTQIMQYLPPDTGKEGCRVVDWLREYNE